MNWSISLPLNKEVCKQCVNKYYALRRRNFVVREDDYIDQWDNKEENRWNQNRQVICEMDGEVVGVGDVDDDPPDYCPYELEHVIATQ
jgi:hypothetical protein